MKQPDAPPLKGVVVAKALQGPLCLIPAGFQGHTDPVNMYRFPRSEQNPLRRRG